MTKDTSPAVNIPEHPHLAKLIAAGATTGTAFRGYVGPSKREGHISLYTSLDNLSEHVEIARADVLACTELSESGQPAGRMILWVRKDAPVTFRRSETVGTASEIAQGIDSTQVTSGRLRIQVPSGLSVTDNCHSNCSEGNCFSNCRLQATPAGSTVDNCFSNCSGGNCFSNCRLQATPGGSAVDNCFSNCNAGNCFSNCRMQASPGLSAVENCFSNCSAGNCFSNCR